MRQSRPSLKLILAAPASLASGLFSGVKASDLVVAYLQLVGRKKHGIGGLLTGHTFTAGREAERLTGRQAGRGIRETKRCDINMS